MPPRAQTSCRALLIYMSTHLLHPPRPDCPDADLRPAPTFPALTSWGAINGCRNASQRRNRENAGEHLAVGICSLSATGPSVPKLLQEPLQ
eukprot:11850100-Alexandrium_andersonii.AAC.1